MGQNGTERCKLLKRRLFPTRNRRFVMQKKDFETVLEALKRAKLKSTAAIKDFLSELDEKSELSALKGKRLTARARLKALFDEGTFVETGAFIKRRPTEFDAGAAAVDDFEGVITGYGAVDGRLVFAFAEDYYRGMSVYEISEKYYLSKDSIKKIIYKCAKSRRA